MRRLPQLLVAIIASHFRNLALQSMLNKRIWML